MGFDLDKIELVARRARDSFGHEEPSWYNGGWSEDSVSPDVVLALVARIRELEYRAQYVEPVYLAAKGVHQLTDLFGDEDTPHMMLSPAVRRLVEALEASYGKL